MNKINKGLRWITLFLKSWFPARLPVGVTAFSKFASDICFLYGLPDERGYHRAIAEMILHMQAHWYRKSPRWFYARLIKGQANEVAFAVMDKINKEIKADAEADKQKAKEQEATQLAESQPEPTSH